MWTKIVNTGYPSKGLYKVFTKSESRTWEVQVARDMGGMSSIPGFNPNLFFNLLHKGTQKETIYRGTK